MCVRLCVQCWHSLVVALEHFFGVFARPCGCAVVCGCAIVRLRVFVRCVYSVGCACSICVCGLWCFHVFVCDMWLLLGTWSWYVELTQFCFCGLRSVIYSSSQFVICGLCGCERLSVLCMVVWCFHALVRVVWLLLGAWSWWVVLTQFFFGL